MPGEFPRSFVPGVPGRASAPSLPGPLSAWGASAEPRANPGPRRRGPSGQLGQIGAQLAWSEVIGVPERLEDALPARTEARRAAQRPRVDAAPLAARHRGQTAAVQPAVDPDVPELVQRFTLRRGRSRQIDPRLVVVAKMGELVETRLGEAPRRELARQDGWRTRTIPPRARPRAASRARHEIPDREGEPRRAGVVGIPLDVRVVVAILGIDVHVQIAHHRLERELAHGGAEHRLGRLAQGKIAGVPANPKTLAVRTRGAPEGAHQPPPTARIRKTVTTTIAPMTITGASPKRLPL